MLAAVLVVVIPPILFEKYTFFLYLSASPDFFTFSGYRLWFDLIWFGVSGVFSAIIFNRDGKAAVLPSLIASAIFVLVVNVPPFCDPRECYVSSTDGLAFLRDYLLLAALGISTSAVSLRRWFDKSNRRQVLDVAFELGVVTLLGYALSFFQLMHIFAGVSAPFPENYLQWFLSSATPSVAGSMLILGRGNLGGLIAKLYGGTSGVLLSLLLAIDLPCGDCSGYALSIASILFLAFVFALPAWFLEKTKRNEMWISRTTSITAGTVVVITIILMWGFFFVTNYEMSVVNGFSDVSNSSFSQIEVGHAFAYAGGYLAIPRVDSQSVGVNISFGNTTINQSSYPRDFLSAGVGDQSPNCCKDGLDLAYRADLFLFSNGTEAAVARAWWACDVNIACGGYSWQQLLHIGSARLPDNTISNWVNLEMNWSSPTSIDWFYRITYTANHTTSPWVIFSSFTPPKIQNHYWDAGLFYVGSGNLPTGYAYFYQFGVSSAYPIEQSDWHVFISCPDIVLNGSWNCIPRAGFINGAHSMWKVLYTFGRNYPGVSFSYLGNYEVEFYFSGTSPSDGTLIWG